MCPSKIIVLLCVDEQGNGLQPTAVNSADTEGSAGNNSVACLVAIGRLQVTSFPNCSDLNNQSSSTEFISRHSVDGKYTFVDQR